MNKQKNHRRSSNNRKARNSSKKGKCNNFEFEVEEIEKVIERCQEKIEPSTLSTFSDIPLSSRTLKGLEKAGYTNPTDIQRESIALGLRGCDILGAAKTGSGKTLAFLVPVVELLWKEKFSSIDGLGALIISPTRELAYQSFEVLRKFGSFHNMSAGLVIGGKSLEEEQRGILTTNIIVCTPGRLLQHMDETPNFECNNLKILVLDEADRILDMGFANTMNAIIENLPPERQTMLFSATQTKSVKDLARLSLKDPEYVSVHENSEFITPQKLIQSYVVCDLQDKLNFLYSFIKNHTKSKVLVFMSSCKQVKFTYEVFRKLRPGIPLMPLYGKQKQLKRVGIYEQFCRRSNACLFATDIAARGLDFPAVHWVVQLDCPEDTNTYIHRVGRTARYHDDGQALLILLPSELEMISELNERKIPIEEIKADPKKLQSIERKLEGYCAQNQEMKHWAQRSIVSYTRSVFLQSNKKIFDIQKLPIKEYATAIGLPAPPRIRFMKKLEKKIGCATKESRKERKVREALNSKRAAEESEDGTTDEDVNKSSNHQNKLLPNRIALQADSDDEDDDVLVLKRKHQIEAEDTQDAVSDAMNFEDKTKTKTKSKIASVKTLIRKGIKLNTKITFDEEGEAPNADIVVHKDGDDLESDDEMDTGGLDVNKAKSEMRKKDKVDRKNERERIKRRHQEIRLKQKEYSKEMEEVPIAVIADFEPEKEEAETQLLSEPEDEEDSNNDQDTSPPPKKKRRKHIKKDVAKSDSKSTEENLSLLEDEELALHLLAGIS